MTLLYGTAVTLRPVSDEDIPALGVILAAPEVARWCPRNAARRWQELGDVPGLVTFAIEFEGRLVGGVQYHEEPAPAYRHATIDVFLDPGWHGKGLGADALRTLARHLFYDRGHHRLSMDPAVDNVKAIRTYQRVGFRPVGVLRQYERAADGQWQDGLLMDLLKRDLQ